MKKVTMIIEYNGAHFHGWQKQPKLRTVQGELEEKIEKLTGEAVEVIGSGRTDSGVHALGQVALTTIPDNFPITNFKDALNNLLDSDVRIIKATKAKDDFHPRFSAKKKTYQYVIDTKMNAIENELCTYYPYEIDIERMRKACELLIGEHNFKAFCSAETKVTDFRRTIYSIKITKRKSKVFFEICGSGFLYNMVRIIVGTLLQIDKVTEENVIKALSLGERSLLGKTMPPNGLYLKSVEYV